MNHATLGFGCMRLPLQNADDPTSFDIPATEALFDQFLEEGFTYFDTAYTYHGYHGEEAVGRALSAPGIPRPPLPPGPSVLPPASRG